MERLTRWNGKKWVLPQGYGTHRMIAEKLAAYENTGLCPKQLAEFWLRKRLKSNIGKDDHAIITQRLTTRSVNNGTPVPNRDTVGDICMRMGFCDEYDFCEGCPIKAMIDRLCEYEDIGLTPAGIKFLKSRLLVE